MRVSISLTLLLLMAFVVGCGDGEVADNKDNGDQSAQQDKGRRMPGLPNIVNMPPGAPAVPNSQATPPANNGQPPVPAALPNSNVTRDVAKVGDGIKGQRLEQDHVVHVIAYPAKSLFAAEQKIAFEIQIPHALDLYKALQGNFPKTHEEFMQKIIKENRIELPELPPQHRYVYDPQAGQLMVERPRKPGE